MPLFKRAPWEEQFFGLFIEKYTKEDYNYFKFDGKLVGVRNSADPALLNRLSYDDDDEYFKQKRIDAIRSVKGW